MTCDFAPLAIVDLDSHDWRDFECSLRPILLPNLDKAIGSVILLTTEKFCPNS
jgi:hypothetical protein